MSVVTCQRMYFTLHSKKEIRTLYSHTQLTLATFRLHMTVSNTIRRVGGNFLIPLAQPKVLNMQKQTCHLKKNCFIALMTVKEDWKKKKSIMWDFFFSLKSYEEKYQFSALRMTTTTPNPVL